MTALKEKGSMKGKLLDFFMNNKALVILLVLCAFSAIVSPVFFTPSNLMNVVRQVCVSAIMGVGFTCVISSGNLDLSVGTMMGMLGVIVGQISKIEGMPFAVAILLGLLVGAFCGFLNGFIGMQFRMPLFIVTLAMGQVYKGVCYLLSNTTPVTGLPNAFKTLGQGYLGPIPIPIVIAAIVAVIIYIVLNKTVFGRQAIATGGNREAARTSGINVKWVTIAIYIIMGVCSAIGAVVMTGRAASAQHMAGQGMEMDSIAAVVIGGTPMSGGSGKVVGTLFGCLIVGVIANILNLLGVDSNWQLVAKGLLILVAVGLDVLTTTYFNARMRKGT